MKKITTLALAAIAFASTASAEDFTVTWHAPTVFVEGSSFDVKVQLRVGEEGAKIPSWVMGPGAFEVDGKPAADRDAGSVSLPANAEVTLDFNLGQVNLSFSELNHLQAGSCYELESPANNSVSIVSANRTIAQGDILQIGDRLGVRITQLINTAPA